MVAMELTADDFERIPRENLRVARAEFVALWTAAERLSDEHRADWYAAGVVVTCRWLAGVFIVVNYPHGAVTRPASSPITHTSRTAHEELIEREWQAVERQLVRHPNGIERRPGWLEGVSATLRWAWHGSGRPPVEIGRAATG